MQDGVYARAVIVTASTSVLAAGEIDFVPALPNVSAMRSTVSSSAATTT